MVEVLNTENQTQIDDNLKAGGGIYHHQFNAEVLNTENEFQIDDNSNGVQGPPSDIRRYQYIVKMSCGGCSGAVGRALDKIPEVVKRKINLQDQLVDVWTTLPDNDVLAAIKKTGKEVVDGKELPVQPGDLTD